MMFCFKNSELENATSVAVHFMENLRSVCVGIKDLRKYPVEKLLSESKQLKFLILINHLWTFNIDDNYLSKI